MPRHASDPELKADFSARIREILQACTAQQVAKTLGVRRQMVYNYRDGKNAPSPEVIRRAMEAWPKFSLSYRGKTFTLQDFDRKPVLTAKKAEQYELWEAIKKLGAKSVEIEILERAASSVQIGVRISFRRR